ncbi:hypothetical protein BsIDN1_52190 [Bacillus safensis]|uniref:Uncharacterized protein n=1 Tax=Bacillus safensis TaxID=561879 RepID=A0A5S9MF68_BACIA|nr:hypothetical protein BsIDN1_52190 [Bacillus safensis]
MSQLMEELSFRGLIQQQTDEEGLTKLLAEEKKSNYTPVLIRQLTAYTLVIYCQF